VFSSKTGKPEGLLKLIDKNNIYFIYINIKNFCKTHCIQHVQIAVGSLQANGQVERYNKTIKEMIPKLMHEKGRNWKESLQQVQLAINNTYNRSIKNT